MVQFLIKRSHVMEKWLILELQGELISRYCNGLAGNVLGDIHFTKSGEPILIVGHHILLGRIAAIEKPFGVMVRGDESSDGAMDVENQTSGRTYTLKAIIKKKIVFKSRPKPIIMLVPKHI